MCCVLDPLPLHTYNHFKYDRGTGFLKNTLTSYYQDMKESTTEYTTEYMTHFFYQMVLIPGFPVEVRLRPPCSLFGKRWQWSPEWVWKLGIYYPQSQWQLGTTFWMKWLFPQTNRISFDKIWRRFDTLHSLNWPRGKSTGNPHVYL